jgi:hypothetical protein
MASLSTGFQVSAGHFNLSVSGYYDFLRFEAFDYEIQSEGSESSDERAPDAIVRYPVVNLEDFT